MFAKQHNRSWQAKSGSAVQSEQWCTPNRPLLAVLGHHHALPHQTHQLPTNVLAIHRLLFFSQSLTSPKPSCTPCLGSSRASPCPAPPCAQNTTAAQPCSLQLFPSCTDQCLVAMYPSSPTWGVPSCAWEAGVEKGLAGTSCAKPCPSYPAASHLSSSQHKHHALDPPGGKREAVHKEQCSLLTLLFT